MLEPSANRLSILGADIDTHPMLYSTIIRSKLLYGRTVCIASNTKIGRLNNIRNAGFKLTLAMKQLPVNLFLEPSHLQYQESLMGIEW